MDSKIWPKNSGSFARLPLEDEDDELDIYDIFGQDDEEIDEEADDTDDEADEDADADSDDEDAEEADSED